MEEPVFDANCCFWTYLGEGWWASSEEEPIDSCRGRMRTRVSCHDFLYVVDFSHQCPAGLMAGLLQAGGA